MSMMIYSMWPQNMDAKLSETVVETRTVIPTGRSRRQNARQ